MTKRAKFQLFVDVNGLHRWRLRAANGEIVAQSEAYRSKRDAERAKQDAVAAFLSAVGQ